MIESCHFCHKVIKDNEPQCLVGTTDTGMDMRPAHQECAGIYYPPDKQKRDDEPHPERKVPRRPSATERFDDAIANVTLERGEIYGHPEDNFSRLSIMANGLRDCQDPILREVLYMILSKVARLVHSPDHLDSWIDIAGYARTGTMIMDRRSGHR
jgi:uncharacterized protein DUF6378